MAKRVFYSFHYSEDSWRASQVRNIGVVEGNQPARDNDWEKITNGGDEAIKNWIDDQMKGRGCLIVLVGAQTSEREWIRYEIIKAWNERKTVLGIRIHNLLDSKSNTSFKGKNPFDNIELEDGTKLSTLVPLYDPKSYGAFNDIRNNIENWIDLAYKNKKN